MLFYSAASYTINQYVPSKMPNNAGLCCLLTTKPKCRKDCLDGKIQSLNVSCAPSIDQYHVSIYLLYTKESYNSVKSTSYRFKSGELEKIINSGLKI